MTSKELIERLEREFLNIQDLEMYRKKFEEMAAHCVEDDFDFTEHERMVFTRAFLRLSKSFQKAQDWLLDLDEKKNELVENFDRFESE